jgi:hypothetical protein
MADNRQKRKPFLTVHRQIVTVDRLNLSFRIEPNQPLNAFPFLILKNSFRSGPTTERAARYAGDGGGTMMLTRTAADPRKIVDPVDNSR